MEDEICKLQNMLVQIWDEAQERHVVTAWMHLEEKDRQAHLFNGLKEACQEASLAQDSRAMCPEIKISSMMKRTGKAWVDFISSYTTGKKDVGVNNVYHLPSKWWARAVGRSRLPSQELDVAFAGLTNQRNEFISKSIGVCRVLVDQRSYCPAQFLIHSAMSVIDDLTQRSVRTDLIADILKSDAGGCLGRMWMEWRDKPILRCENCTQRRSGRALSSCYAADARRS
jgi:hypothetical protein